jgi:hypothetical protein
MIDDIVMFYTQLPLFGKIIIILILIGSGFSLLKNLVKLAIMLVILAILVSLLFKILDI